MTLPIQSPISCLTDEEIQKLMSILEGEGKVLLSGEEYHVSELRKFLDPNEWINGDLLNEYLSLRRKSLSPDIALLTSFDFDKLKRSVIFNGAKGFDSLKAIVETKKRVIYPVNVQNKHWLTVCLDTHPESMSLVLYDSLSNVRYEGIERTFQISFERLAVLLNSSFLYNFTYGAAPQQLDESSCGISTVMNSLCLCNFQPLEQVTDRLLEIRQAILFAVLSDQIKC